MRVVSRCYPDGVIKPHLRDGTLEGTFKADVVDESGVEEAVEAFREFVYDSLEEWFEEFEYDSAN